MAKSKAYLSFVILFAFLLSSHVLAHELQETSSQNQHSYKEEGIKHSNPTSSQDSGLNLGGCFSKPSFRNFVGHGYKTPRSEDVGIVTEADRRANVWMAGSLPTLGKSTRPYNAEVDESGETKRYWTFPRASRKTMPETRSRHYSHSATYNPSNLEITEPKNYEDASIMRHRNMVRPSEIDWKTFHAFQAKTFGTNNGGKTSYGGVPRMEDVGEETKN